MLLTLAGTVALLVCLVLLVAVLAPGDGEERL